MTSISGFVRIEPRTRTTDVTDGLAARVHDPLWLMARQWQLGEFLGEDAGTPTSARLRAELSQLTRYFPDPRRIDADHAVAYSPSTTPLESLVEREIVHGSTAWTPRAKAEAGLEFLHRLQAAGLDAAKGSYLETYPLHSLTGDSRTIADAATVRYTDLMAGRVPDGELLFADLIAALPTGALPAVPVVDAAVLAPARDWLAWCDDLFDEPGADEPMPWQTERMEYALAVSAPTSDGEVVLEAPSHPGGVLDWHSFAVRRGTGLSTIGGGGVDVVRTVLATPLRFNGMPDPRWWQIEDANVDLGRVDASGSDLARLLVVEYALLYGGDFYSIPIDLPLGSICRTRSLVVTDTFGVRIRVLPSERATVGGSTDWQMFTLSEHGTAGSPAPIDPPSLFFLPPVLGTRLTGGVIEDVRLLRDEMANMAWGVERSVESGAGGTRDRAEEYRRRAEASLPSPIEPNEGAPLRYVLGTTVPDYWFPLVPVTVGTGGIRLKRGAMASLSGAPAEPYGELLDLGETLLYEEEVPREGAQVTRAWQAARWIDGSTHVWIGRRKQIGRGEGSSGLHFDVVD